MKPKFCPNCGKKSLGNPQAFEAEETGRFGQLTGYDCYCRNCHWSGDVLPDFETVKEFNKAKREFEKKS